MVREIPVSYRAMIGATRHKHGSVRLHVSKTKSAMPPARHEKLKMGKNSSDEQLRLTENLICGAIGRTVQILTMFPVDTVKTRVQVSGRTAGVKIGSPISQMGMAIQKGGLYNGAMFSLIGQVPYGMVTFGLYETLKKELFKGRMECAEWIQIVVAAAVGDSLGSLWLTPSEVVKSKTQARVYPSAVAAVRGIWQHGVGGFYQGYGSALARDIPFRMLQLSLYEYARRWYMGRMNKTEGDMCAVENLMIGAFAGTMAAATTTPLDVIRTRMMTQKSGAAAAYKNVFDCVVKTVYKEGAGALVKGIVPRCLLIGPSSAVLFVAFEASKSFFRRRSMRKGVEGIRVARMSVRRDAGRRRCALRR